MRHVVIYYYHVRLSRDDELGGSDGSQEKTATTILSQCHGTESQLRNADTRFSSRRGLGPDCTPVAVA